MRPSREVHKSVTVQHSRFDVLIEWLLIGLLFFMPIAFGVVHAWSEEVVIAISGAIVVCFLLKHAFDSRQRMVWSWVYVPVFLFIFVVVLQLIPLPAGFLNIISPNTVRIKQELLGDLTDADKILGLMTLSFYSNATKHDLRLVLSVAGVFFVVFNIFRQPEQIKRLLLAIVLIGAVIAAIVLGQNLFGNGKIYWFISSEHTKGYSGPFVNHSNYGQFMNLSLGAALGLLMVKLREVFRGRKIAPPIVFEYLCSKSARSLWLLLFVIGLTASTVFMSLTRGGIISMLIAISFTTLLFVSQRSFRSHGWVMVVMALIAFICVLYIGFDAVYERLSELRNFHEAEGGRLQILKDIAVMWTKFPLLGTGFGTHSVVYPMFERTPMVGLATHAENEYAQVLEETGLLGLSLLVVFGAIIWSNYFKSIQDLDLPVRAAVYGLGFGLLAMLVHSLSDFGQHLSANSILSAIFCALLLVLARKGESRAMPCTRSNPPSAGHQGHHNAIAEGYRGFLSYALLACVIVVWIWALIGADNSRVAESYWKKAVAIEKRLSNRNWHGSEQEYSDLISYTASASAYEPGNVKYQQWLNVYRWRSISQIIDPNTGQSIIPDDLMPMVYDIVRELHKARMLCPTYGPSYSVVGQIERFVLGDDSGADRIRKGYRLAPSDPIACFVAGYLNVMEGEDKDYVEKFNQAVQLDGRLFASVANIYVNYLNRPYLAITTAGEDVDRLGYLSNILEQMEYKDLTERVRDKMRGLLEVRCSQPNAPASVFVTLGRIYSKQRNEEDAIEFYRRALAIDYSQVHWRLELAQLLARVERIPEAMREAKICLKLRPQFRPAERLVADFSVHPSVLGEEENLP